MPTTVTVGDGHGTPDYTTAQLAWDDLSGSDQGGAVTMQCLGDCGVAFTPTGTPSNAWSMRTESIDYDGTNDSSLATLTRPTLSALIDVRHMHIDSNHAFIEALRLNSGWDEGVLEYCFLEHNNSPNGVDVITTGADLPNSVARFCVLDGGINGVDYGFAHELNCNNLTVFGAAGDGFEGNSTNGTLTDCFAFNNTNNDFINVTTVTCASEDTTGDETGYGSSELVNFGTGDYRTKDSSDLATAGSGGSFIGAFLEPSSGLDISPTGIASTEVFGTAVISTGAVTLSPTGIASVESFGTAAISQATFLTPSGIASEGVFGTAVLTTGAVVLSPTGISSTETFGIAVVTQGFVLIPTGIISTEAFGVVGITTGGITVTSIGINSAEVFGTTLVAVVGAKDIKIDFQDEVVIATNLQSKTLYFNGTNYFTIE